jgi:hypothetical protein
VIIKETKPLQSISTLIKAKKESKVKESKVKEKKKTDQPMQSNPETQLMSNHNNLRKSIENKQQRVVLRKQKPLTRNKNGYHGNIYLILISPVDLP